MWNVKYADGNFVNETSEFFWDTLPKDKKIEELQVFNQHVPTLCERLSGYDAYYYAKEAVSALHGNQEPTVIAEIFGGICKAKGTVDEVRMGHNGIITRRTFPIKELKYTPSILRDGKA
jgi:hypothetical protein